MKKLFFICTFAAILFASAACTRIETGHVGVRTGWSGEVQTYPLGQGWHNNVVGHIDTYVANEITLSLNGLRPQTKDRTTLDDLDLVFTYSVNQAAIPALIVRFKGRDLQMEHSSDILPLGLYVQNVMTTATGDVVSRYDALIANTQREAIKREIKEQAERILKEEGLQEQITIHQVFIKALNISKDLQDSALKVIKSQNELTAKDYEVQTAKKEAERLGLLAANHANIDYMNARSMADVAEGIKNGKVNTVVLPFDFRGMISVGNK